MAFSLISYLRFLEKYIYVSKKDSIRINGMLY